MHICMHIYSPRFTVVPVGVVHCFLNENCNKDMMKQTLTVLIPSNSCWSLNIHTIIPMRHK